MAEPGEPQRFGGTTTFVCCDAADVKEDTLRDAAVACLEDRGLAFQLVNQGEGPASCACP